MHSNRQFGTLPISDDMDCLERGAQLPLIDLLLRASVLESCLCFGDAIFDGFHTVAAGERAPCPCPVRLQDDVGVDEHGIRVSRHDISQLDRALDLMCRENLTKVLDRRIKKSSRTPHRDQTLVDGESEYLHKRF